jgi:dTDP-4-amino-4,6-dideoxygalactose transaminase
MKEKLAIFGGAPVRKNMLIFGSPLIGREEIGEVVDTLKSGWLSTGPRVIRFEEDFKKYIGSRYALALNSCSAGLHLALIACGIKPGDEVITTPFTFAATANVICHLGAKPVFADIEKDTLNISPGNIERKITSRTKALLPVHFAGHPCKMDEIMDISRRRKILVIEDAAHALEAEIKGLKVGRIGHITSFSFYATKNLTTGEGGMVTTDIKSWAEKISALRLHGLSRDAWKRYGTESLRHYEVISPGFKYNMMDIQAAMGIHQLNRLEKNHAVRKRYFHRYNQAFKNMEELELPVEKEYARHAYHLYVIRINRKALKAGRDEINRALRAENIGTGIHFISLHRHPYYQKAFRYKAGDFPVANDASLRVISLPFSARLTPGDVEDVIRGVRKVLRHFRR